MDAITTYKGYAIAELSKIFDAICNPDDWKAPITAVMPGECVLPAVAAIEFYTATTVRIQLHPETMTYIITAPGYRAGPAGDH